MVLRLLEVWNVTRVSVLALCGAPDFCCFPAPSCGCRTVVTCFLWQFGIQLPPPPTSQTSAWLRSTAPLMLGRTSFLPGGRVGRVSPDWPSLQPTTVRPGAADPHRLQDSATSSCQRCAVSAGPSDGPRISTGTDEIASMFGFYQHWVSECVTPPVSARGGVL